MKLFWIKKLPTNSYCLQRQFGTQQWVLQGTSNPMYYRRLVLFNLVFFISLKCKQSQIHLIYTTLNVYDYRRKLTVIIAWHTMYPTFFIATGLIFDFQTHPQYLRQGQSLLGFYMVSNCYGRSAWESPVGSRSGATWPEKKEPPGKPSVQRGDL